MSSTLNNKNLKTSSIKIKKASLVVKYMAEKISENQNIKRLLRYNTKNPLSQKGIGYNNEVEVQKDITSDLINEHIYDIGFNPDTVVDLKNDIYINLTNGRFTKNNTIYIDVNIIIPENYLIISNGYRNFEIAQCIADIFDEIYIDAENGAGYYNELGAIRFDLVDFNNYRLSKTNSFVWTNMTFEVDLSLAGRAKIK